MARQPFLPKYAGTPTSMASFMIEEMPEVAQFVGRITVNWSGVDLQMSLLLGSLIGVENEAAVAVFLSLRNHRAQRDALVAAADRKLDGARMREFRALISIHKRLDKQRNDVVHGVWGKAEKVPDGIIWCSLQDHANMLIRDYHNFRAGFTPAIDRAYEITKDCFVVRYCDLAALNEEILIFSKAIGHFHAHLRYKDEPAGEHSLKELMANALIQQELGLT